MSKYENKRYTVLKAIHLKIKDINDVGVWTTGKFTRNKGVINEGTVLDFSSEFQDVYDFYINNTLEEAEFSEEEIKKFIKDGVFEEWFEEVCWLCRKAKLVHSDECTTYADPGFICKECEDKRKKHNEMCRSHIIR